MTQKYPKRLIEVDLLIRRISANARAERDSRLAHIPRMHIYPAARPLAACRAVICASLWLDPADELCPEMFRKSAKACMNKWATRHLELTTADSYARFIEIQKNPTKLDDNEQLRDALLEFIADFSRWESGTNQFYLEICNDLTLSAHKSLNRTSSSRPLVVDPFSGGGAMPLEAIRIGANAFASDLNPVAITIEKLS